MIYGIGTDIIDIRRVRDTLERRGERFAEKVLGENELAVYRARRARVAQRGLSFLATRFSAKEAFSKAIGMGMRMPMTWRAMQVLNAPSGKPMVVCSGALQQWMEQQGLSAQHTQRARGIYERAGDACVHMFHTGDIEYDNLGPAALRSLQRGLHHLLGALPVHGPDERHDHDLLGDRNERRGELVEARLLGVYDLLLQGGPRLLGLLALPKYGGNKDNAGWALIGVEDNHYWEPPFGYYDRDYPGFEPYPGTKPYTA